MGKDLDVIHDSVEVIHKGHITRLPSNLTLFEEPANDEMFREVGLQVTLLRLSNAHDLPGRTLAEVFPRFK